MVAPRTLRLLQILSALNVVLALAIVVVRLVEGTSWLEVAPQIAYGLGFVAMFLSCVRELAREGAGRVWMALGGLLLVAASVLHFVAA